MITVLTGENSFALQQVFDKLLNTFVGEHGDIAVERLNGDSASLERIQEALQSSPFLAARKLVVLREPGLNKQFTESAEHLLTNAAETTDVILIEPLLDKRSGYYKWLKQGTQLQEFAELDELGLARWLTASAKEQGGELGPADARLLVGRIGTNQQLVAGELNKLLTYDPHITQATIELLTEPTPQGKIFDLLDAAFSGNARRALELYRDQRAQKVDPSQIIAMIAWQLRVLAIVMAGNGRKPVEVAREARLSPYVVQKSSSIAAHLSIAKVKALIKELLDIDVRSKRERIDLDEDLQDYLLALSQ